MRSGRSGGKSKLPRGGTAPRTGSEGSSIVFDGIQRTSDVDGIQRTSDLDGIQRTSDVLNGIQRTSDVLNVHVFATVGSDAVRSAVLLRCMLGRSGSGDSSSGDSSSSGSGSGGSSGSMNISSGSGRSRSSKRTPTSQSWFWHRTRPGQVQSINSNTVY
jgi:hypothetical protein